MTTAQKRGINEKMFGAIDKGDFEGYMRAVWSGADIHARLASRRNMTTLMVAARGGYIKIANDLNSRGVKLNAADHDGLTAEEHAAAHPHLRVLLVSGFRLSMGDALRNGFHHLTTEAEKLKATRRHIDYRMAHRHDSER